MSFLSQRQFTGKFGQNHAPRLEKGHFLLTCVAQKLHCLSSLLATPPGSTTMHLNSSMGSLISPSTGLAFLIHPLIPIGKHKGDKTNCLISLSKICHHLRQDLWSQPEWYYQFKDPGWWSSQGLNLWSLDRQTCTHPYELIKNIELSQWESNIWPSGCSY